jgi:hypothetical protein
MTATGICSLPTEILVEIAQNINDYVSVVNLMLTCKAFNKLFTCNAVWRPLFLAKFDDFELEPTGSRRTKRKASAQSFDLEDTVWFTKYRLRQGLIKTINVHSVKPDEGKLSEIAFALKEILRDDQNAWQLKTMESFFRECGRISEVFLSLFAETQSGQYDMRDDISYYAEVILLYCMYYRRAEPSHAVDTNLLTTKWVNLSGGEMRMMSSEIPRSLAALTVLTRFPNDYFEYESYAENIEGSYIGVYKYTEWYRSFSDGAIHVELKLNGCNRILGNGHGVMGDFDFNGSYDPTTRQVILEKNYTSNNRPSWEYRGQLLSCGIIAGNWGTNEYGGEFVLVKKDKLKLKDPSLVHFSLPERKLLLLESGAWGSFEESDASEDEAPGSAVQD